MRLHVEPGEGGGRLDVWLASRVAGLSRSRLQALIREGSVRVNGASAKPNSTVAVGAEVCVEIPPPASVDLQPQDLPLTVLYEDAEILVLNKPAGLVVHPAAGHADGTLVNALLYHCADLAGVGGERRPGIVHRLDKDTSGVMVVCKHDAALEALGRQFREGGVAKEYVALVQGVPLPATGTVRTLIGRSPHDRKKMAVTTTHGRPAVTHYRVVETLPGGALLRVRIETGRTHQIRVHLAHLGFPVAGDRQYGTRRQTRTDAIQAPRQMLHAAQLAFTHPRTGKPLCFEAPLPPDMEELLSVLRAGRP